MFDTLQKISNCWVSRLKNIANVSRNVSRIFQAKKNVSWNTTTLTVCGGGSG